MNNYSDAKKRALEPTNYLVSLRWLLIGILLVVSQSASAVTCSINSTGVAFGNYDVFSAQNLDGVGSIGVTCDVSTAYSIALSPGSGSFASRSMASGANQLNYNLYTDAARTTVWGDGTSGTATVSGTAMTANHSVYGRIPSRQNMPVGSYSDNITLTLTF
jgi:spore coat protein U-like protein